MFIYKGYTGLIEEIDVESGMLCGCILGIKDVITFQGKTLEEARKEFETSVNDYLDWCKELA